MGLSNKTSKFLIVVISTLLILTKNTKVLAESKLPLNTKKQIQFLEEKRISQSLILEERQKNATVEGMLSSKDIEDIRKAEVKESEMKDEQKKEIDTFSEIVNSIRKLQNKQQESKQVSKGKPENQTSKNNNYYKNTNIPIIKSSILKAERTPRSESVGNTIPGIIKDLLDQPIPNREPIDMGYSDLEMLERIVMAEAGGEPYLGQIAVANVVLNRVKSSRYPSTLKGVIFQKSQFSPVKNSVIRGRSPNESVKKAVAEALNGRMIVPEDTLYFVNPILATDQTVPRTKIPVKVIGSHTFYK